MMSSPFNCILLKLAARCNLACPYCYWFRDQEVYAKPARLTEEVEDALLSRLKEYIETNRINRFSIFFHGGEPTLFGKSRFTKLCQELRVKVQPDPEKLSLSITTNGFDIDREWALLFKYFDVSVTLSIDGPKLIHDKVRLTHNGSGSFDRVMAGLKTLQELALRVGILCVTDPATDPRTIIDFFVKHNLRHFDLLMPDENHESLHKPKISEYYNRAFSHWWNNYAKQQVEIRFFTNAIRGLLGRASVTEAVGYGPISLLTINTDGTLEPLDVLRIRGNASTDTPLNIQTHGFDDIRTNSIWLEAYNASLELATECRDCPYLLACGGGYLPHRWSAKNGYNNPSVYCGDLKEIFRHIQETICNDVSIVNNQEVRP